MEVREKTFFVGGGGGFKRLAKKKKKKKRDGTSRMSGLVAHIICTHNVFSALDIPLIM